MIVMAPQGALIVLNIGEKEEEPLHHGVNPSTL